MANNSAELADTAPTAVKVVPSSEYCQVPLPVSPTRAIPPITALLSVSVMVRGPGAVVDERRQVDRGGRILLVVPNEGFADVRTGAALLARTFMVYCC